MANFEDVRLAELLAGLGSAGDYSAGQAPGSSAGAAVLAVRLARAMGLSEAEQAATYYAAILRFIGCTSTAAGTAAFALGDDLSGNYAITMGDVGDPESVRANLHRYFAVDAAKAAREKVIDMCVDALPMLIEGGFAHCEQAIALSARLPVPEGVVAVLAHLEARWDGKNPCHPAGADLPMGTRIVEFAAVAELYRRAGGIGAMRKLAAERSGGQFDPAVCHVAMESTSELVRDMDHHLDLLDLYLSEEPGSPISIGEDELVDVAEVIADFTDCKSEWLLGHSRQVARLARLAALELDLADPKVTYLAGLLHDVGRSAVPNGVWDHPGPLDRRQRRMAERHSDHTEDILATAPAFDPLLEVACSAHERVDGTGYHRRSRHPNPGLSLIGAADIYVAMVSRRPWRPALTADAAAEHLLDLAEQGHLAREAVRAVLRSSGHGKRLADRVYPDGITAREAEVLRSLARGLATKEIAAELGMALKTADNHVQRLYAKIGATSRVTAAMYALQRGFFSVHPIQ